MFKRVESEVEVREEVLAENLLHHLRRMEEPKDLPARVNDRLTNRLCVNPPSRPGCPNPVASKEVENEGPTPVQPGDGLLMPTPAFPLHPTQLQPPPQAHQQLWRMSPDEEDLTNDSNTEEPRNHLSPFLTIFPLLIGRAAAPTLYLCGVQLQHVQGGGLYHTLPGGSLSTWSATRDLLFPSTVCVA